jgi:dTDP-4-amino-4,6-dideoxy-D-galactose acyltransferase
MEPCLLMSQPDAVRSVIRDSVPWSPFDFVKGISVEGDRAVHAASLLRDIDPADDLRMVCPISEDADVAVCAERLPWDTKFFGYGVARLHGIFPMKNDGYRQEADYTPAIDALTVQAKSCGVHYLFAVVDSRDLPTSRALTARGWSLIETRLFYHLSLRAYHHPRRFRCRFATKADLSCLIELARTARNPFDRFNADPFIAKADAARLIETWIRASLLEGFADATFIPDMRNPGALCTLKYHRDKAAAWNVSIGQIVLAMASSPRAGNGFVGVISEAMYHLKEIGLDRCIFSTQITNRAVVRVGEHLGFKYGKGEYVFRQLL